jgi:hypothetical protein
MEVIECPNCGTAVLLPYVAHDQDLRHLLRDGEPQQQLILSNSLTGTALLHMCDVAPNPAAD